MQANWKALYERFVDEILTSGTAWVLVSDDGYAQCASERFADVDVIPLFSSKALADAAASSVDGDYRPEAIPLDELLDDWLPGMDTDGVWAGIDWGEDWSGLEIEALQLLDDLLEVGELDP
jgi:hypothetical protein